VSARKIELPIPAVLGVAVPLVLVVLLTGQEPGVGRLDGNTRYRDNRLPGTRITVSNADLRQSVISDREGRFLFPKVPEGVYSVSAELGGFQAEARTDVRIVSGRTTTLDFHLQIGCVAETLWTHGPALAMVLREADTIVHLRISAVGATERLTFGDTCLIGAEYQAVPVRFVGDPVPPASLGSIRFVQEGEKPWYAPGQEYVAFLGWEPRLAALRPVAGRAFMLPVKDGRVSWTRTEAPGVRDQMRVEDFFAAFRPLLPASRQN
jgi:hypothetical protein